jgi:hypothetical protein
LQIIKILKIEVLYSDKVKSVVFTFEILCAAIRNISEDTVTASILADEIKRQGIHVQVFEVWKISVGIKKPDVYLWNGGQYVIESKFKERDYLKAVTKLYDSYIKICDELQMIKEMQNDSKELFRS